MKRGDGRSRLIDQGFNDDGRHPGALHVDRVGSTRREVDNASASLVEQLIATTKRFLTQALPAHAPLRDLSALAVERFVASEEGG